MKTRILFIIFLQLFSIQLSVASDTNSVIEDETRFSMDTCHAEIIGNRNSPTIIAIGDGTEPLSYHWSNGDSSEWTSVDLSITEVYCVTITDVNGCEASTCKTLDGSNSSDTCLVRINREDTLLQAIAIGTAPFNYEWRHGEIESTISIFGDGVYCVKVTDADGCISEECFRVGFGSNCNVELIVDSTSNDINIMANADGVEPFRYFWNTGETSSRIDVEYGGTYCVEIFDALDCSSSQCVDIEGTWSPDSCEVELVFQSDTLYANPQGIGPFTFEWDNGETSNFIIPNSMRRYCVTVTSSTNCEASECMVADGRDYSRLIEGVIYHHVPDTASADTSNFINLGRTILTVYELSSGIATEYRRISIPNFPGNRSFSFEDVPDGDYIIKAEQEPNTLHSDLFVPTYHRSEILWDDALMLSIPGGQSYLRYDIDMIFNNGNSVNQGNGRISGNVDDPDGLMSNIETESRGDNPIAGATLLLYDAFDQLLDYRFTDDYGNFEFENLEFGTYKVMLELTGYEHAFIWATLNSDNLEKSGLLFEVTDSGVTTDQLEDISKNVLVYPNPVEQYLNIEWGSNESGLGRIEIFDLKGTLMLYNKKTSLNGTEQINLQSLKTGMYLYRISHADGILTGKFIKD